MSSVIQNLKNISIFKKKILTSKHFNDPIIISFQKLLNNLLFSNQKNVSLLEFKNYFGSKFKKFEGDKDNDSAYFLIQLINHLHKIYNNINNKKISKNFDFLNLKPNEKQVLNKFLNSYETRNNSFILDLFYGYQMFRIICSKCDHCEVSFQSFNILDIPLMDNRKKLTKLEQCINTFLYTKSNYNSDFECKKCHKNDILYSSSIIHFPKILIINLKRLGEKNEIYNHYVEIPQELDTINIDKLKYFKFKYYLKGFIRHNGGSNGGHNIAYLKNMINDKWYIFNDDNNIIELKNISFENAFLLFYETDE